MTNRTKQILYWAPRILSILFAIFISLFALDVFTDDYEFPEVLLALLMHLIPTAVLILITILAWRWEWIGMVVFVFLATFYIVSTHLSEHWAAYVTISGTMYVMGALFTLNWIWRKKLKDRMVH